MDRSGTALWRRTNVTKYLFISKIGFKDGKVYPLEMLLPSIVVVARLWVFTLVLNAAFATKHTTEVNGFTVAMSMWVLMVAQAYQQASKGRIAMEITQEIQSGAFATVINKPLSYGLFHYFRYIGNIIPSLAVSLGVGAVAVLLLVGPVHFSLAGLLTFLPALFLGATLNFVIYFCVGLTALWLEDAMPVMWIVSKTVLIFGGLIVPIALLPEPLRQIAEVLPFAQLFALPAQLLVAFSWSTFIHVLITQLAWLGVLCLGAIWFFRKGRAHVASNGG